MITRRSKTSFEDFLGEIGERYVDLVVDQVGIGIPQAYCSYLVSTGHRSPMILIDGGNSFNPYLVTHYSKLFSVDERKVLQSIQLSRAFTCHQLSALLGDRLELAVQGLGSEVVVISDPVSLYVERAPEEDVVREFMTACRRLVRITYSRHLTTLIVHTQRMPHSFDRDALERGRRRRAGRYMERELSKISDSIYRLERGFEGLSAVRVKHPYFPPGSIVPIRTQYPLSTPFAPLPATGTTTLDSRRQRNAQTQGS